jgi:RHS repeat-associated protein
VLGTRDQSPETRPGGCLSGVAEPVLFPIDSNGNLTTKTEGTDVWSYEWNARNELTRLLKNGVEQTRFSYDPMGRRVEKVAGGITVSYAYDSTSVLREASGGTSVKYVHGPSIDEPLAVESGGVLSFFHGDALGSIVKRTDAGGTVDLTRQYDAWGKIEAGAGEPGYAFTGREWDPDAGLYYYRARYYDAGVSRFLSEDPIHFKGGLNFYSYVKNRPVNRIDPLGLAPMPIVTCKKGVYGLRPNGEPVKAYGMLCCHGGQRAICVEEGQYRNGMSMRMAECMRDHEQHHSDLTPGSCRCKDDCSPVPLTGDADDRLRQECEAQLISLICLFGSDERYPDGQPAMSSHAYNVLMCQVRGYLR